MQPGGSSNQLALPAGMQLSELVVDHVEVIPPTTDEGNPDMESEFFDTRQAFLSLCQGNHYQFDTMRRAKHSSMMVLYHLHNPQVRLPCLATHLATLLAHIPAPVAPTALISQAVQRSTSLSMTHQLLTF